MNIACNFYQKAKEALGTQLAPDAIEELGCAYSVDVIYMRTTGHYMNGKSPIQSTTEMYNLLRTDARFTQIPGPGAGCIIISPTGTGIFKHGHVGILGAYGLGYSGGYGIMSNDSYALKWLENFSIQGWNHYFGEVGGMPVYYFRVLN